MAAQNDLMMAHGFKVEMLAGLVRDLLNPSP
jgi:hypothetical protein